MTTLKVKLDAFEGPLDLLLHLIDKAEVDIYQVSISMITDQYLHILEEAKALNLEIASEFTVMAATLLAIKSRMLLPPTVKGNSIDDEEAEWIDPREELIERLLAYKQFKRLGDQLEEREAAQSEVFSRFPLDLTPYAPTQNPLIGITVDQLLGIYLTVLEQQKPEPVLTRVAREEISVSERMNQIYQELLIKQKLWFSTLMANKIMITREWLITTFLAILELMKTKQVSCIQDQLFMDICITLAEAGETA